MAEPLDWETDGAGWPHRAHSGFVEADGSRFHVQRMGAGPTALLIHGVGASTHSWADLLPLMAETHDAIAFDLPGHGFTQARRGFVATPMNVARATAALLDALGAKPDLVIGHSAGAAVMLRMIVDGDAAPARAGSVNGALMPFDGAASVAFPMMAKALHYNPFAAVLFSRAAREVRRVERLIAGTGSTAPPDAIARFTMLFRNTRHVSGALAMMAIWDLTRTPDDLRKLTTPALFIAGEKDRAVPPADADRAAALAPAGESAILAGLGHLAHEEDASRVLRAILGSDVVAAAS
ncbi:MAG: alpha/beta fold hydrolase BchO [Parvularculaceae bacterium]